MAGDDRREARTSGIDRLGALRPELRERAGALRDELTDNVEHAAEAGVSVIAEPGGSARTGEVASSAAYGIPNAVGTTS